MSEYVIGPTVRAYVKIQQRANAACAHRPAPELCAAEIMPMRIRTVAQIIWPKR